MNGEGEAGKVRMVAGLLFSVPQDPVLVSRWPKVLLVVVCERYGDPTDARYLVDGGGENLFDSNPFFTNFSIEEKNLSAVFNLGFYRKSRVRVIEAGSERPFVDWAAWDQALEE